MVLKRDIFDTPFNLVDVLILASLRTRPRHGYELEAIVVNNTLARVLPGTSSVYKALKRLERERLVVRLERSSGERRQYYDTTEQGRNQLGRDLALLRHVVRAFDECAL